MSDLEYIKEKMFDDAFYIQKNTDLHGIAIPLEDELRMRGTHEYPVTKITGVNRIGVKSVSPHNICLQILVEQDYRRSYTFDTQSTWYVNFLFYDFYRSYHLLLLNAEITDSVKVLNRDFNTKVERITLVSTPFNENPAWISTETEHTSV